MVVSEDIIHGVIAQFEKSSAKFEVLIQDLSLRIPKLFGYMYSDSFQILSNEEEMLKEYLFFVCMQSIQHEMPDLEDAAIGDIADAEDRNWEIMHRHSSKDFRKQLDAFFEDSSEEDLLAFLEDSLTDEENEIGQVGREVIFVGIKTIIDCLLPSSLVKS